MEELIKLLKEESLTCIVEQQHQLYREHASGILPILHMLDQKHLQGAHLADKVIGKAAALLMVRGGVTRVHALILSSHALQIFQRYDVSITYDELVPYIINRARTGMCPINEIYQKKKKEGSCKISEDSFFFHFFISLISL